MSIAANETPTARKAKTYTVIKTRKGIARSTTGTLAELVRDYSYTLECGHSYNSKINTKPTTIKGLITALNKSVDETQRGSYNPTYYEQG